MFFIERRGGFYVAKKIVGPDKLTKNHPVRPRL